MRYGLGLYGKTVIYLALTASVFGILGLAQAQEKAESSQNQVMDTEPNQSAADQREAVRLAINRERERVHQRIEMIRMWSLVSELNMDEVTAKQFFPVINEIRERRLRLTMQINVLKKRLVVTASKSGENGKGIEPLLAEYKEKMAELNKLGVEEFERLSKILNPVQQVQYIIFGDRFHRDLQVIIRQAQTQSEKNQPETNQSETHPSEKSVDVESSQPQEKPESPK